MTHMAESKKEVKEEQKAWRKRSSKIVTDMNNSGYLIEAFKKTLQEQVAMA